MTTASESSGAEGADAEARPSSPSVSACSRSSPPSACCRWPATSSPWRPRRPTSELKPHDKGENSEIFAADGSRLGYVQSDIIRTPVPWSSMPRDMRLATVAIEDERFYKHKGVDYGAIVRAGVKNIESGTTVQGGSTITQQLVRALYIKDPKRNFERKIREAKLASELEKEHSKTWILRELPQRRALRHGGRAHGDRRRGGVVHVLQQARAQPDAGRVGAARRPAPGALAVQPVPQPHRRHHPPQRGAGEDGGEPLHHHRRGRGGRRQAARPEARHALHAPPRAVLLRLRPGEADRGVRRRRLHGRGGLKVYTTINPASRMPRARPFRASCPTPPTPAARSSRSTRTTATSARWPPAAPTRTAASTSPPRATASRARRSRRWC